MTSSSSSSSSFLLSLLSSSSSSCLVLEAPTYLACVNAHERDAAISFDEPTHVYTIAHEASSKYTSVTTLNGGLFEHFDAPAAAARIASKPNKRRNKPEYYDKTAAELVAMWAASGERASRLGTALHLDIERFFNGLPTVAAAAAAAGSAAPLPEESVEMGYFRRWWSTWRSVHLTPWRTEWCVYWEEYKLAGSIDMVFRDPDTGVLEIYDWKRVCKPLMPDHDCPKYPKYSTVRGLEHVPDNEYWHYALQLNMYRRILETQYGETVTALALVVLHPDNASYRRIELPFLPAEIDAVLAHRRAQLLGGGGDEEEVIPVAGAIAGGATVGGGLLDHRRRLLLAQTVPEARVLGDANKKRKRVSDEDNNDDGGGGNKRVCSAFFEEEEA